MQSGQAQGNVLRIGRIVKTYPAFHAVDLVFTDDGGVAKTVPILTNTPQSQKHGSSGLPDVDTPPGGSWAPENTDENDMLCVVAMVGGMPIVMGFVTPVKDGMGFDREEDGERVDKDSRTERHPSGTNTYTDGRGNICYRHGTALKQKKWNMDDVGKFKPPETGEDRNGRWEIPSKDQHIECCGESFWGDYKATYSYKADQTDGGTWGPMGHSTFFIDDGTIVIHASRHILGTASDEWIRYQAPFIYLNC